ncbi:lysophospholipase [Marinifilum sp. RC60d5]|uniref:lysophospholipase n=1 Tax=Marinifilum sp. RC60d5 TaxID=3458414 RepID=UPI0040368047
MIYNKFHINSFDNTSLFVQSWSPKKEAKAILILVHGIGEHSSRYQNWAEQFVNSGFAVLAYDQRGHGLSSGKRGVISSYDDFMSDIDQILLEARQKFPSLPQFLYGHSMGGGEVLNHLIRKNANYIGVISTSPWIISQASPPKIIIPLIRFFNYLIPNMSIETKLDADLLSHNKEISNRYDKDELVHNKVSFRLFIGAYDAGYKILNSTEKIKKPLLVMHGSKDKITDPKASEYFASKNKKNCTFKLWDDGFHELHNENFSINVFHYICKWMNKILSPHA